MNIWTRLTLWAAIVALHFGVLWAFPVGGCWMGIIDSGGPIFLVNVREQDIWVHALLMLSVLVLMPLGYRIGNEAQYSGAQWSEDIAACLLGLSLLVSRVDPKVMFVEDPEIRRIVPLGFILSLPWLFVRVRMAVEVVRHWHGQGMVSHKHLCSKSARIFPAIGAAWLVANRANWTPWHFDPLIVLLTAAHFHHAGFTLPLMAWLNAKARPSLLTKSSCIVILAGVPMVAMGITCTHFGIMKFVEPIGVTILVLGALGVAVSQILRGVEFRSGLGSWVRAGFLISGTSLCVAMVLAMSFGLRYVFPQLALTMPQMWAIHGTLNAFGFGLCGILAWRSVK